MFALLGAHETVAFNLGECAQFRQWRFVAAVDYSDDPENLKVVVFDTGVRPVTKCSYEITVTANQSWSGQKELSEHSVIGKVVED